MIPRLTTRRIAVVAGFGAALVVAAWLVHPAAGSVVTVVVVGGLAVSLTAIVTRARAMAGREAFRKELELALSTCGDEEAAARVAGLACQSILPGAPGELLLTDLERTRLDRVAVAPSGAAGCGVQSLADCVALRHGTPQVFTSSTALSACKMLADRGDGPVSAVCAPVGFASVPLGVLHLTGPDGVTAERETLERLSLAAERLGTWVGTLRIVHGPMGQAAVGSGGSTGSSDSLTGLLDRSGLEDQLRALARAGQPFSLALADVDHLADINEAFGIESGDHALVLFASVLRQSLRGADLLARFGGEEFALVFPETDSEDAAKLLERIQFALGGALATGDAPHFTVSFGVADTVRSNGVEGALGDAEAALLLAKASGRNRIVVARRS